MARYGQEHFGASVQRFYEVPQGRPNGPVWGWSKEPPGPERCLPFQLGRRDALALSVSPKEQ